MKQKDQNIEKLNSLWTSLVKKLIKYKHEYYRNGNSTKYLKNELSLNLDERKKGDKYFPALWYELNEDMKKNKEKDSKVRKKIEIYELTKTLFSREYELLDGPILKDIYDFFENQFKKILKKKEIQLNMYKTLINHFANKNKAISSFYKKKIFYIKVDIVAMLLDDEIVTQSEIRRLFNIPIKDRSNFKKIHIVPLIVADVVEEIKINQSNKPYYKLTDLFLKELAAVNRTKKLKKIDSDLIQLFDLNKPNSKKKKFSKKSLEIYDF